jgi:hypothetical protein
VHCFECRDAAAAAAAAAAQAAEDSWEEEMEESAKILHCRKLGSELLQNESQNI